MPAWSPEIANEFIDLAAVEHRSLTPMQLQRLVYVAHGWCLASTGEPLTGDRPEAWPFGPVYRRLMDALAPYGTAPVERKIFTSEFEAALRGEISRDFAKADLDSFEMGTIAMVFEDFGALSPGELSELTRGPDTAWAKVHSEAGCDFTDISHKLISAHELLNRLSPRTILLGRQEL